MLRRLYALAPISKACWAQGRGRHIELLYPSSITIFYIKATSRTASSTTSNHHHCTRRTRSKIAPSTTSTTTTTTTTVVDQQIALQSSTINIDDQQLLPWLKHKKRVPLDLWNNANNRRKFFDWAAKQLNIASPEDWYAVTPQDISRLGGGGLLSHYYDNSLAKALSQIYNNKNDDDDNNNNNNTSRPAEETEQAKKDSGSSSSSSSSSLYYDYNNYDWVPWRFASGVPHGYWKSNPDNHRRFFDWAAKQLNVQQPEDWYSVPREAVYRLGGSGLLSSCYRSSLIEALSKVYPEVEWLPWRFASGVPSNYWKHRDNHRRFFDWVARELNVREPEDWYRVTVREVYRLGGTGLLMNHYGGSLARALPEVYPSERGGTTWLPWRFAGGVPHGFWEDRANHRRFFDWAARELNLASLDDWYEIPRERVFELGGTGLLTNYYESSLIRALLSVYPDHDWMQWRFASGVIAGFWDDVANHRRFFDWVARELNVRKPEDWYSVTREDVLRLGGSWLLQHKYEYSLVKALSALYPPPTSTTLLSPTAASGAPTTDTTIAAAAAAAAPVTAADAPRWDPWKFKRFVIASHNSESVSDKAELRRYVELLGKALKIEKLDEWYRVSASQVRQHGGYNIIAHWGGLYPVLRLLYPEHPWDEMRFHKARGKKSSQRWLKVALNKLYQGDEIVEEFHHPDIELLYHDDENTSEAKNFARLDLWIPSHRLAFEYHGEQHYHDVNLFGDPAKQRQRDADKAEACKRAGITLVVVPYWWDKTEASLAELIRESLLASSAAESSSPTTTTTTTTTTSTS